MLFDDNGTGAENSHLWVCKSRFAYSWGVLSFPSGFNGWYHVHTRRSDFMLKKKILSFLHLKIPPSVLSIVMQKCILCLFLNSWKHLFPKRTFCKKCYKTVQQLLIHTCMIFRVVFHSIVLNSAMKWPFFITYAMMNLRWLNQLVQNVANKS